MTLRWRSAWLAMRVWVRVTWVVSVGVGLTGIAVTWGQLVDGTALRAVGAVAYIVTPAASGLLIILVAAALKGRFRRAWLVIGAGVILLGLGEILWEYYVLIGVDAPYPGVADVFFLSAYPVMFVGVLLLPQVRPRRWARIRLGLDVAAGTVAIAAIVWAAYLADAIALDPEAGVLGNMITVAYPIMDLGLLVAVLILSTRRSPYQFAGQLIALAMAMLATAMADLIYMFEVGAGTYRDGSALDALWLAGYVLFAIAAFLLAGPIRTREQADRPSRLWPMIAPYTAVTILIALAIGEVGSSASTLEAATAAVVGLIMIRQGVAIRENRDVVETQRNDLVASISHELRTPITAISGFIELMDEDPDLDRDERAEMINIVSAQTQYLSRIVGDLIYMARARLEDIPLILEDVAVSDLIASAIDAVGWGAEPPTIAAHVEPGLTVRADHHRIRQALVNYLTNAARYGGGIVQIQARSTSDGALIEVHDNGVGVPKKHEFSIWDRFERGAFTFMSDIQGSGLGLPITRGLVAAHHGRTGYRRSEHLGGACFWLTIPSSGTTSSPARSIDTWPLTDPPGLRDPPAHTPESIAGTASSIS